MDQHFDAERLAAFVDGSLSREDRAAMEAHAADCARCLQLVAAMVRTEPPAVRTRGLSRIPMALRWSVPLLAGATALALWVNVREAAIAPQTSVASRDVSLPAPSTPDTNQEATEKQANTKQDAREREAKLEKALPADRKAQRAEQPLATPPPSAAEPAPLSVPLSDSELRRVPSSAPSAPAAAPPPAGASAKSLPGVAGTAPQDTSARFRSGEAIAESVTVARQAQAPIAPIDVVSPDGSGRWRVAGNAILRSTDAGKTWSRESVPVQSTIAAGAAPSPSVAWFVGRSGYILLTTGTNQWRRVTFTEPADLVSVSARSESEADVTTSDGRVFTTADGGRTWTRR